MAYQELDAYVAEQIAQGIEAKAVKEALLEIGWKEVDVDNALRDVAADSVPTTAVSVHDDIVRMRHAVVELDRRVSQLETDLAVSPIDHSRTGGAEATLPSGHAPANHQIQEHHATPMRRIAWFAALALVFVLIGYAGMSSIMQDTVTPLSRIWAQVAIGVVLAGAGFVTGRMKKRSVANLLTGTGLAMGALATVGAWYVHYMDWTIAVALGALLVTLALVLGRFYDQWALVSAGPMQYA